MNQADSNYMHHGKPYQIIKVSDDLYECKCSKGYVSGSYDGYCAAATAIKIYAYGFEHEIDAIDNGQPITVDDLFTHCRGWVETMKAKEE